MHSSATLVTARLTLRPLAGEDISNLVRGLNDWQVARNLAPIPFPYSEADALDYFPKQQQLALEFKAICWVIENGSFAGLVAVDRDGELGYWLLPEHWNRGFATEAALAARDFAFEHMGCLQLVAGHAADNPASGRVLEKLGFMETERGERYYLSRRMMVSRVGLTLSRARWESLQR